MLARWYVFISLSDCACVDDVDYLGTGHGLIPGCLDGMTGHIPPILSIPDVQYLLTLLHNTGHIFLLTPRLYSILLYFTKMAFLCLVLNFTVLHSALKCTTHSKLDSRARVMIVDAVDISLLNTQRPPCPQPSMNNTYCILYTLMASLYTIHYTLYT